MRARWLTIFALVGAWAAPTGAQETATQTDNLGQRLAKLRNARDIPEGSVLGVQYMFERGTEIARGFPEAAAAWLGRAEQYLRTMESGKDPYLSADGEIVNRAYRSSISESLQGYAVYLPPGYDHTKSYPLIVVLHGGSSNGNLFLGVVLGNNMDWKSYRRYWWNQFEPRWKPNWIVVSPDGFGQVMWRWMGEQDVLDVIDDVQRHYRVDPNRIVLAGLSNGGVGAYAIGMRHAAEFSAVQAMAGAPSWFQYTGGNPKVETRAIQQVSAIDLAANATNTQFHYYHGTTDTGPMKPRYVREFEERVGDTYPIHGTWYDAGHDILYRVFKHGRAFSSFDDVRRNTQKDVVEVASADYRANRQDWITITRIGPAHYPPKEVARVSAVRTSNESEDYWKVKTADVDALRLELSEPCKSVTRCRFVVDGQQVILDPVREYGEAISLVKGSQLRGPTWKLGFPTPEGKRSQLSGPISDAYFGRMVHVFGTQVAGDIDTLKKAAQKAARGWPLWPWNLEQAVIEDDQVTEQLANTATLVLYGNARSNSYLKSLQSALPIQIFEDGITVGDKKFAGATLGTRFIYPNPKAPGRYIIVQGGPRAQSARDGNNLPDFVPDYVVFDSARLKNRPRLIFNNASKPVAAGYFDVHWNLPQAAHTSSEKAEESAKPKQRDVVSPDRSGSQPADGTPWIESKLDPPEPPPPFELPESYLAPWSDQAGKAGRQIARRYANVENYRTRARGGQWRIDEKRIWRVRKAKDCHQELEQLGIAYLPRPNHPTPLPSPVQLLEPVNGVWFRIIHDDRPLIISCELATRLPRVVKVLKKHGIKGVDVMSAYRTTPRASFHTAGLALDLSRFWDGEQWHTVADDFESQPHSYTCAAPRPKSRSARKLLAIACSLDELRIFATVLTPHYNLGHWDHFHLDMRPHDPRFFLR